MSNSKATGHKLDMLGLHCPELFTSTYHLVVSVLKPPQYLGCNPKAHSSVESLEPSTLACKYSSTTY